MLNVYWEGEASSSDPAKNNNREQGLVINFKHNWKLKMTTSNDNYDTGSPKTRYSR